MNWHKTNLALIVILIVIDAFLCNTLIKTYSSARLLPEELITQARENLALRSISFDDDSIDKRIYSKPVYRYSTSLIFAEQLQETAFSTHPKLMQALCKLSSQTERQLAENVRFFDIPDGTSISVSDESGIIASAQITGVSGFEFSLSDSYSEEVAKRASELLCDDISQYSPKKSGGEIRSFYNKVYGSTITAYTLYQETINDGTLTLCVTAINGDDVIINMPICFYIKQGEIVNVFGNLFYAMPTHEYTTELIDGINILYYMPHDNEEKIEIVSQKIAYNFILSDSSSDIYVAPIWIIETAKGAQTFNALTGMPIKIE